jgi:hypothetical protein
LTAARPCDTIPRVNTWPGFLAAALLTGCGARTGLYAPPDDYVDPGPKPRYCQDAADTSIYVVTEQNDLLRFDPPTAAFTTIGAIDCPVTTSGSTPFSMAVDHEGTAYVVFDDGELFTVSTATAACTAPSSPIDSAAFTPTFGMGFTADQGGEGETLFLAGTTTPGQLGTLDTSTFVVGNVGTFSTDVGEAELTGTGGGELFAFGVVQGLAGAHLAQVDPATATVLSDTIVPTPQDPDAWAFGFWGGDFYFFTSVGGVSSTVGRYHPVDGSFDAAYTTVPGGTVTGAGVSTCAPR